MYEDRKMKKYLSFDALSSSKSEIEKMKYKKFSRGRKILSEDRIIELNKLITTAYKNQLPVAITYYHYGYSKMIEGSIKYVNQQAKTIVFTNRQSISFYDVEDIKLVRY